MMNPGSTSSMLRTHPHLSYLHQSIQTQVLWQGTLEGSPA